MLEIFEKYGTVKIQSTNYGRGGGRLTDNDALVASAVCD
jgi:hypothetical protein